MDVNIFDSALSHTRSSDALKKREEKSVSTFGRFPCGQVSSLRLYRLKNSAIDFDEKFFPSHLHPTWRNFCHAPPRKNFIKQILLLLSLRFFEFLKFAFCLSGMVTGHETAHFGPWHWL